MEFFKKIFLKKKCISIDPYPSQVHTNIVNNMDDTDDDSTISNNIKDKLETNMTPETLENVPPIEIRPNSQYNKESNFIEIVDYVSKPNQSTNDAKVDASDNNFEKQNIMETDKEFIKNEISNDDVSKIDDTEHKTDENLVKHEVECINYQDFSKNNDTIEVVNNKVTIDTGISNDMKYNTEYKTVLDDSTSQSMKEFEDTFNNFDKHACLTSNSVPEIIDLDEFDDIFDKMNTEIENSRSQNLSTCPFEHNSETAICDYVSEVIDTNVNVANSEYDLHVLDNIKIISVSTSNGNAKSDIYIQDTISINSNCMVTYDSDCESYHSSDFEFISETEARLDGFIINFRQKKSQEDNSSLSSSEPLSSYINQNKEENRARNNNDEEIVDPGEGPSGLNRPKSQFEDRSYRNNHAIPEGDGYLDLFRGIYNPFMPIGDIYFMENKSVRASSMNCQYAGIGFDKQFEIRRHHPDSSEEEFENEAKENVKKILNMYPGENRKKRRRY